MFCKKLRVISGALFGHTFWKKYHQCDAQSFFEVQAWHTKSQQDTHKKLCTLILSALKLRSYELLVFIDMNNYTFIEGRNFKTFLKDNYAIVLHSCYMFTKKMLNMELNMMLIVPMEFAYIIHSWTLHFTTATKNAGPFL